MKEKSLKSVNRFIFCCVFASLFTISAQAQDEIDKMLQGTKSDAEYLLKGYLNPFMQTVSLGLNQGWYNTAKPHKVAGVDLTLNVNPIYFPGSAEYFTVDNTKLT